MPTRFDVSLCWRVLGLAAVLSLLTTVVVLATDEAFSTLGMRIARLSVIAPPLAAVALGVAVAQAERRGEIAALCAIGATPLRVSFGGVVAGWCVGAIAVAALCSGRADPSSLFPTVPVSEPWRFVEGALASPDGALRVMADGVLHLAPGAALPASRVPPGLRAALALLVPLALVLPPWVALPRPIGPRIVAGLLVGAGAVFGLHAVAAGRMSAWLLPLVAAPLGLEIWRSLRAPAARPSARIRRQH